MNEYSNLLSIMDFILTYNRVSTRFYLYARKAISKNIVGFYRTQSAFMTKNPA